MLTSSERPGTPPADLAAHALCILPRVPLNGCRPPVLGPAPGTIAPIAIEQIAPISGRISRDTTRSQLLQQQLTDEIAVASAQREHDVAGTYLLQQHIYGLSERLHCRRAW